MSVRPEPQPRAARPALALLGWLALAVLVAAFHGRALDDGLFMDDYAHFRQLREAGWSLTDLVAACRLELVGGVIEFWWLPECTLRFFRPVAFALMKLVYECSGWSPVAAHVASLAWHALVCGLLFQLLRRLGVGPGVAWWTAGLFALHPAHTATVQWIASQTELIVSAAALGLALVWARREDWGATGRSPQSPATPPAGTSAAAAPRPVRWPSLLAAWGLFAFALGCRENAFVLPGLLLVGDLAARRGRGLGWRAAVAALPWGGYVGLAVVAGGYLALRAALLEGGAIPPRPYVFPPTDPGFVRYVIEKACYYVIAEFWLVPAVPIGGLAFLRDAPLAFYAGTLAAVLLFGWLVVAQRRSVDVWLGTAWLLLGMLPVLPVFESPHHLYLPGIGWALLTARGTTVLLAAGRTAAVRNSTRVALGLAGVLFGLMTYFNGLALSTAARIEDNVITDVIRTTPDLRDGDTLYVANLPVIAHYVRLGVEERTGRRGLRAIGLSWAPRVLGVQGPSECRRIDPRTIEMHMGGDDRYFDGPFARLVHEANGRDASAILAEGVSGYGFRAELGAPPDADGLAVIRIRFDQPWDRPGVHLYWGSSSGWARRLAP